MSSAELLTYSGMSNLNPSITLGFFKIRKIRKLVASLHTKTDQWPHPRLDGEGVLVESTGPWDGVIISGGVVRVYRLAKSGAELFIDDVGLADYIKKLF